MNVHDILASWLKEKGFDGLCCGDCGCGLEDLLPCDGSADFCEPAYKHGPECNCCPDCEGEEHYSTAKQGETTKGESK